MKVVFVFPYPSQTAPSQRFRFEQYLTYLTQRNIAYDLSPFLDQKTWQVLYKPGHYVTKIWGILKGFVKRFLLLLHVSAYDFVFIHREATPLGFPFFEFIVAKVLKKKIIYDFDDAIWLPNTSSSNQIVAKLKFHAKTALICKWAYKVSVGNEYLGNYAKKYNSNIVLNPTTIDTENLHNTLKIQAAEKIVIGWTGTHSTIQYLNPILPVIKLLEKKYHFDFLVISDKKPDFSCNSLVYLPWNKITEIQDLLKMDIGIMPLTLDQWAEGKCGFKALQYMALGIPPVASSVGVNKKIIQSTSNGFLCDTTEEWLKALSALLEHPSIRIEMGNKARSKVENEYSVKSNYINFLLLFT